MRTLLFSRSTYRLRNMVPTAKAPLPGPGVGNALNLEAIQQVREAGRQYCTLLCYGLMRAHSMLRPGTDYIRHLNAM